MRIFIAIFVPDEIKKNLLSMQKKSDGIRWAKPEQIHLTLNFIGEITEEKLNALNQELAKIAFEKFELHINGCGFFPNINKARIFWAGITENQKLKLLKSQIDELLSLIDLPVEKREFKPHLTLARISQSDPKTLAKIAKEYENFSANFIADYFGVYSSILQSGGAVHKLVARFPDF